MTAVVAVLASLSVVGPVSSAQAGTLTGSSFEVDTDANLVVNGASTIDWLSVSAFRAGALVRHDLVSGGSDDSFKGTKEDSAVPTVDAGSIPPNKSDLKDFGLYVEKNGSDVFLNVFWTRVQDPSGTTNMDFEFNQSALTKNDPSASAQVVPVRTTGDLLLTYDLTNGGTVATVSKRFWSGSSWGAAIALGASDAIASINTTAIPAASSGGLGSLSPRTFGEASVNLGALLPAEQGCTTFGSAYLKSRSSAAFDSELKDFIAPQSVAISNCGSVTIHKSDANGPLSGAGFTAYKDVAPVGGARGAGDTVVAGTCTTDAAGDCTVSDLKKGDYWVVETTIPAGHDAAADQHVSITAGDQVVPLSFVDPIQTGTITVIKEAVPEDAQDFAFALDTTTFALDDDSDPTLPSTRSFTVPVGMHTVSEPDEPSGWVLTGLTCTGTTTVRKPTATITLAKDQHVTCTFTNSFTKRNVALTTQAAAGAGGSWTDTASLTGDGTHPVTGTVAFFACAAASIPTACTTGGTQVGTSATVTHGSGTAYTAVTTTSYTPQSAGWTCLRAEFDTSSAFYADATHTNTTTECFLKQAKDLTVSKTATAAYGRLYHWTIDKSVDHTRVTTPQGGSATSAYAVTLGNTYVDSAWTVTGAITVTNPNPVPFTGVAVTDAIDNGAGACAVTDGSAATVPAGGALVVGYSCTYGAEPSPSAGTNTATATWNKATFFTPAGTASGTATVDFSKVMPSVTDETVIVTDSVNGVLGTLDARTAANPTVFRYTVDRSGQVGTCTTYPNTATFVAGDTETTASASASVVVCVGADLGVATTAVGTRSRDDLWTLTKDADRTKVSIAAGGTATVNYSVTVSPSGVIDSSYALSGLVTVTNPNDWEPVTADVTTATTVGGGAVCTVTGGTAVVVPAAGQISLPYSCIFSATPSGGTVTGTATWIAASTPSTSASDSAAAAFAVTGETHTSVTVVDDRTDPANPVTLGTWKHADGPHTFTYSLTKSGVAGECTDYTNTASLLETGQSAAKTVTVCVGLDLTVTKTALATDHRTFLWNLAKDADQTRLTIADGGTASFSYQVTATPAGTTDDGWSVTGQITVTNPNHWQAITADITDVVDSGGGAQCTVGGGSGVSVAALATVVLDYACTFASKPADGVNTATATWDEDSAATPHGTATGTADVVFVPSSKTDETITVVDDKTDPAHPVTLGTATYGDGAKTFTYTVDQTGTLGQCTDYTNTAVISETEQSASKVVTVCVGAPLTATVTAGGSFARDDLWTLDKTVDQTSVTLENGAVATFRYTVTAAPAGVSDSGYALSGTVTLTNPNAWEPVVADVALTTDLGGGAVCTAGGGTGASVPAGSQVLLPFSCTFTGAPATTGTVTVTVTWDATLASTALGTTTVTAPAVLAVASEGHRSITVVDDKTDPAHPVTLGSADHADGTATFSYSLTKVAANSSCATYTNIATIVETEQSDSQAVKVCGTFTGGGGGNPVLSPPVTVSSGGGLPITGDLSGLLGRWALALLLSGGLLLALGRRRLS